MTTEVVIMNRRAAVLAADSAGTVTSFANGKAETRYFKGENKVFQLSEHHPMGLMTFGNAHVLQVPWDIIVKLFRRELGNRSFPTVEGYAKAFFDYVEQNHAVFTTDLRESAFAYRVLGLAGRIAHEIFAKVGGSNDAPAIDAAIAEWRARIVSNPVTAPFTEADVAPAVARANSTAKADCDSFFLGTPIALVAAGREVELIEVAVQLAFRELGDGTSPSGIVVAGYGDDHIFPACFQYRVRGFQLDKLIWDREEESVITPQQPGYINSFASNAMVETFASGVGEEVYANVLRCYGPSAEAIIREVEGKLSATVPPKDRAQIIAQCRKDFMSDWVGRTIQNHHGPLTNVVSMLSIEEMAHLAENLVSLESLKEKMTRSTETVGGPVDVAAITKSEGFVWIRRKLYFDAALNPRYAHRVARMQGGRDE
ncbi:hypothetical protein [Elioraea rosea]|uniref:hypothetical protein n=1 Tax=Elioraea rosea TaxID=2492390 RepID=UPI001183EAFF|nr:hypothetical protein [Elioraea rosea]